MTEPNQPAQPTDRRRQILIVALIVLGLLLVIFFGLRAVRSYVRIRQTGLQPGATDVQAIRGWMTIPYIAKAYGVPEAYIFEQIGLPVEGNQKKSLSQLNREYNQGEPGVILEVVKQAVAAYQAAHQPTPPGRGL